MGVLSYVLFVHTAVEAGDGSQASSMQTHNGRGLLEVSMIVQANDKEDKACFRPPSSCGCWHAFLGLPNPLPGMHTAVEAGDGWWACSMQLHSWRG